MSPAKALCFLSFVALAFLGTGCGGGGDGGGSTTFTIDPPGPTIVQKGQTLQFNTVPPGVAVLWSVDGGASNGTIGASSGLYTPPSTLPVDPQVTVTASLDGSSTSALVDLRTGDSVAFGSEEPINDSKALGFFVSGAHDLMAARNGSLQVDAAWMSGNNSGSDILFSQATDLAPFGPERNLTDDLSAFHTVLSLDTSMDLNPGMLIKDPASQNIQFLGSSDAGASFANPVPIDPTANSQDYADLQFDEQGGIHVSYVENFFQVRYSRSSDGGAHWSSPPTNLTDENTARCGSSIAVSPDGNTVHVCYGEGICGSGQDRGEGDIIVATSTDGGKTFPSKPKIPGSEVGANCRVALGPEGEIYVSYKKDSDVFLSKSTDGGASFPTGHKVNDTLTHEPEFIYPYMAVDSLGRIDLVWLADPDNDGDTDSLRYARSSNGGTSFSQDVEIASSGAGKVMRPTALDHDDSGRLHLQYITDRQDSDPNANPLELDVFYLRAE